ncbi:cellulase family glycosylhydrolase [Actinoplanes sp. NEAU-A12]|uniref:Cellulase family glycosylhydrolase n=1 Tax=Actinoplanes sandaracinus TaxID=3045177 RepID=A0ABT6WI96_9ACTN|nr:cellulase family glycosylhydrolase [Actinoplanes sandaracinus]MDI6099462.1 cellulase family glycosylhydrolase [Actinoplanes sandaracinus]
MGSQSRKVRFAFLAAALTLTGSVSGVTSPASADVAAPLNASQLVADMGAGWNLGNSLEASANGIPSETAWNNPIVTQALVDRVKAAGFKTIRIPVSYLGHIGPGPNYTINPSWLNRVREVVDYAHNRGLYVLINMHGDGYKTVSGSWLICDSTSQTTIRDRYQKAWQQIATRFQGYSDRLIFESMNENFDGQYGRPTQPCYSNINAYNQIFVDTVRRTGSNNSSRWLLVPGWNTNIEYTAGNYGFVLPTDLNRSSTIPSNEQRIMISVHYYDPWDFTGTEDGTITQWGPAATNPSKRSTWGQEDHLDAQLKKMYDTFVVRGYPVFVGEYGAIDKTSFDSSNNRYRADFARTLVATAKKYGAATAYWDNGVNGQYGFGLFNRGSATVTQQGIVDAIMSAVGSGPAQPSQRYEAETAPAVCQGTIDANHAGYSGTGFCNGSNAIGAYAQFTVNASAAGPVTVRIRFANGATGARSANLAVNGIAVSTVSFESTSTWASWTTKSVTVTLKAGANTIRLDPTTAAGLVNVDRLDVGAASA